MGEITDAVRSIAETIDAYGLRTTIIAILLLGLACFVAWFVLRIANEAAKSIPRVLASVIVWIAAFVLIRSPRARREWIEDRLEYLECYEHDDVPWLELIRQAMAAALILRGVFADQPRAVATCEKTVALAGADGFAADGTGTLDVTQDDQTLSASGVALTEHLTVRAVTHVTVTDVLVRGIEPTTHNSR
jgi:hypothetical protein